MSRAATTLARGHVAAAAVSALIVLPAHEFSCPRAGGVEVSEVFGGKPGAALGGAEQRLRVGVVIADAGREYGGLTPSQYSIASTVVVFSLEPLLPCSTGLIVLWRRFPRLAPSGAPGARRARNRQWGALPNRRSCSCTGLGSGTGGTKRREKRVHTRACAPKSYRVKSASRR